MKLQFTNSNFILNTKKLSRNKSVRLHLRTLFFFIIQDVLYIYIIYYTYKTKQIYFRKIVIFF